MPFRTEYRLHVQYHQGWATFTREELLDFAPFVGLDILDDLHVLSHDRRLMRSRHDAEHATSTRAEPINVAFLDG